MNEELKELLNILYVSVPIGLAVGFLSRKMFPESCKRYAKFCLNGQWKLFLFGTVLFAALAAVSFLNDQIVFGCFFVAFMGLELWALFSSGFKPLSKEMEKRIDESDPRKFRPFRFWK